TLNCLGDRVSPDCRGHDALNVGNVECVPSRTVAIDIYIDVTAPGAAIRERGGDPRTLPCYGLDLARERIDDLQIRSGDLHPDRALDSGGKHVDAVAYRRH